MSRKDEMEGRRGGGFVEGGMWGVVVAAMSVARADEAPAWGDWWWPVKLTTRTGPVGCTDNWRTLRD